MLYGATCLFLLPHCLNILDSSVCMALDAYQCSLPAKTSYNCFEIILTPYQGEYSQIEHADCETTVKPLPSKFSTS